MNKKVFRVDFSDAVIAIVGFVFGCLFIRNATYAFDDMYLFGRFADLRNTHDSLEALWVLFFGVDLSSEYRTYGLARVFHYTLYLFLERSLYIYPAIIWFSQVITAILLAKIIRFYGSGIAVGIAVALAWLLTPFSINWAFHHYTYALLPFQILIAACYILLTNVKSSCLIAGLLGIALAMTGELHLAAVVVVIFFCFYERRRRGASVKPTLLMAATFLAMLSFHRIVWGAFYQNSDSLQRYSFSLPDFPTLLWRIREVLRSIWKLLIAQVELIAASGLMQGAIWATVLSVFLAVIFYGKKESEKNSGNLIFPAYLFFFSTLASFLMYVLLSVGTGQISEVMPRRYGYGAFSLLGVSVILFGAIIFKSQRKLLSILSIFFVSVFAAQAALVTIPKVRKIDKIIVDGLKKKLEKSSHASQGGFIYVAGVDRYEEGVADAGTPGIIRAGITEIEFLQSPFYMYWTAQHYLVHVLGLDFGSMPVPAGGAHLGNPGGWTPAAKSSRNGIVLANLALTSLDFSDRGAVVFGSYDEFLPNRFIRKINRDVRAAPAADFSELMIDIGSHYSIGRNWVADKKFGENSEFLSSWVSDYGYLDGAHAEFDHQGIQQAYAYYRTNRHGAVSYQIDFKESVRFEASFDFWEQWGRQPGERIFDLEVSWDGEAWVKVGRIDPAAINGAEPFSVEISRSDAKMMLFRLVHVHGDVPLIQGVRLRRLS
jgi:hypothetical protein